MISQAEIDDWTIVTVNATPGGWYIIEDDDGGSVEVATSDQTITDPKGMLRADADFIAFARVAMPALLDEVHKLKHIGRELMRGLMIYTADHDEDARIDLADKYAEILEG